MPENQAADSISQVQYDQYTTDWAKLVADGEALAQAFQASGVERINFLTFSIDQISSLVNAPGVALIKARFLYVTDEAASPYFSTTLFALDADGKRLSDYYIPSLPGLLPAAPAQPAGPAAGPDTRIARELALEWLTAWVNEEELVPSLFRTLNAPLKGYNFEVSTFEAPLAAAQPYAGKGLFLNLGLHQDPDSPEPHRMLDLVVYINRLDSRTQGTLAGLPNDESYYNSGMPCPPNSMMS